MCKTPFSEFQKNNIFLEVLIGGYDNFRKELRKPGT
jgi:hypothetical protein